jgi:3-dehydroquinate synthase
LIVKNCYIKQQIITEKRRDLLNWGHTIGHGLEALSHYQLSHGHAIAIGLLLEGELALQLGLLPPSDWERLFQLLTRVGFPLSLDIDPDPLFKAMRLDKKAIRNEPRFILSQGIGKGAISLPITQENYHALCYSSSCRAL